MTEKQLENARNIIKAEQEIEFINEALTTDEFTSIANM